MPYVKNKATGKREWFPSGGVSRNTVQEMIDKSGHVYSVNGYTGKVKLTADDVGAVGSEELPAAIETALEQAKESGEFDGAAGHTPVKGTDYFTAADKQEMVDAVLAALPVYNGEVETV